MHEVHKIEGRDAFVNFGVSFAHRFLQTYPHELIGLILNGDKDAGKEVLALAFDAACKGKYHVPGDLNAQVSLDKKMRGPVVFFDAETALTSDQQLSAEMQEIRQAAPATRMAVFSNFQSETINMLRRGFSSALPAGVHGHIEVTKCSEIGGWFFPTFDRVVTVTTLHDAGVSLG